VTTVHIRLLGAVLLLGGAIATSFAVSSCLNDGLQPVARDTTPPRFHVLTPVDTAYDIDGDKLVDLRLTWSDSAGAVDPAGVVVRSLNGINGPASATTNLLDVWRVERRDSEGLVIHETVENLLHGGSNQFEITVPDTAGNVEVDTITFTLPHGALFKTILTGLGGGAIPASAVTLCPDDNRLYMTARRNVVVMDPDSLKVASIVRDPSAGDDLARPLCVPGDPILYVTEGRVERFDRSTLTWLPQVASAFMSIGIVQSRADPNLLYVGETTSGTIGIIDRAQAARVGQLLPFSNQEYVLDLAILDGDSKLYATRVVDGGILVLDPLRDSVLKRIPVGGPNWPDLGRSDAITLSKDRRRLYAAVLDGAERGVAEIDTQLDSVVRTLALFDYFAIDLGLSPDERRMFVTTQDNGTPSENVLVDVAGWQVLQTFPRPRDTVVTRFDRDVVWHPSGKLVFVTHNLDLDVYLIRE
jgi:hypothetical protein